MSCGANGTRRAKRDTIRRGLGALVGLCLALGGCYVPPTPPTANPRQQTLPAIGEQYWIFIPDTYQESTPAPLIVTCHGTPPFDVADHHIRELKWYAGQHNCILLAPKLVGTDGVLGDGPIAAMLEDERRILSLVSSMGYRFNIDRANIMITGFSGGGFPAYWIGLRHPEVFRCIVARSCNFNQGNLDGWFPTDAPRKPDILIYHGDSEPAAITSQSSRAIEYLRAHGFTVHEQVVADTGHERRPKVAMDFFLRTLRPPRPSAVMSQ